MNRFQSLPRAIFSSIPCNIPCNIPCSIPCNIPSSIPCNIPCRNFYRKFYFILCCMFYAIFCQPTQAYAQRGIPNSTQVRDTPLTGFPGVFDTFTPKKDSFVVSGTLCQNPLVPVFGVPVEYGLSENLSMGTNIGLLPLLAAKSRAFGGKIRYRIPWSSDLVSSFSAWGYNLALPSSVTGGNSSTIKGSLLLATTSYFFSDRFWLNANAGGFWLTTEQGSAGSAKFQKSALSTTFLGAGAQYFTASWFGVRGSAILPYKFETVSDGGPESGVTGGTVSLKAGTNSTSLLVWSFLTDFRIGQDWLLSLGLLSADSVGAAGYSFDLLYRW